MKKFTRQLSYIVALSVISSGASANKLSKPQSMEEMWKMIQAQQQQINEMRKKTGDCYYEQKK